uniref:UBC core domain-containing protein n=1 Tax=Kalanchoe fedtschenkoi TaxID=63787 RepID=A0A7N0UI68_KALFE
MASEIEEVAGADFRQFDVVTDYSDHLFALKPDKKAAECFADARSVVYKKIMQEWKILVDNLPEGIYVRTYESRIDLLRAVILGTKGTPYHDGLFFFDIAFPGDYPTSPPKVYYRSFGLRVNPNLYACGRVCLSILNTWSGTKCEKWSPERSSILQILVSIQALVLNAKPYYNEPGLKPGPNYKAYNEKVFALTCKTMYFTLRAPPRHFEEFVTAHFCQRACSILKAIDAYKNGAALVGYFYNEQHAASTKRLKVSKSFVKDSEDLYKLLFTEFSKIKAPGLDDLSPSLTQLASNGTPGTAAGYPPQATSMKNGPRNTIVGYLWSKAKKVFKIGQAKSSPKSCDFSLKS